MAEGEVIKVFQIFFRGQVERLPGRFNGSGLKREDPALDFVFYQTMPKRHILQLGKIVLPFLPHTPELRVQPIAGYLHGLYLVAVIDEGLFCQKLRILPIRPEVPWIPALPKMTLRSSF